MLRVGLRWDLLEWRDQLDVVESILADTEGSIDRTLDSIEDQIAEMFPEEETWGSQPAAQRGLAAAERVWGPPAEPKAHAPRQAPSETTERPSHVRSGSPYEAALFVSIGKALMAIPRPAPPPTVLPE